MSRTHKDGRQYSKKERHISIRAVQRNPPDLRKLARAIAAVAIAQAEAEAQAKVHAMDAAPPVRQPNRTPTVEPGKGEASHG